MAERRKKAAALRYDQEQDSAPRVTAQGQGLAAENIVTAAKEAQIPIVEDAALVGALLMLELGDEIPSELYQAVAKVLSFLYTIDKGRELQAK